MQFFKDMNLVGNMFVLKLFQREKFDYQEWPKHENYLLVWSEFKIVFTKHTKLIQFNSHVPRGFSMYPLVPSIKNLLDDMRYEKIITAT
ncbi:hypothetical protein Hanom_Chr00s000002g01601111 [Helianthus anomalus]